jgi:hypothetical protein
MRVSSNSPVFYSGYAQYLGFYKLFSSMGFDVFCAIPNKNQQFQDSDLGEPVDNARFYNAQSYFFGPGQENAVEEFYEYADSGKQSRILVAIGLRKEPGESLGKPLDKITSNIKNVITSITPQLLVIDDPDYIQKLQKHYDKVNPSTDNPIKNTNYPLVIYGDLELIQLYVAGRFIYEDKGLYTKVVQSTIGGGQTPTNQQQQNIAVQTKARSILSERDKNLFNDDYITKIAFPKFLQLTTKEFNFSLPSDVFDIKNNSAVAVAKAINDLEIISYNNSADGIGEREKETSIFNAIQLILKSKNPKVVPKFNFDFTKKLFNGPLN